MEQRTLWRVMQVVSNVLMLACIAIIIFMVVNSLPDMAHWNNTDLMALGITVIAFGILARIFQAQAYHYSHKLDDTKDPS